MTITFKVKNFRSLSSPYKNTNINMYDMFCDIVDVPDNIPMDTNPRNQKLNTPVCKKIETSLFNNDKSFYILNRGILLSADNVIYNANNSTIQVTFTDFKCHGNIDGGHTYEIIKKNKSKLAAEQQFIKIEIITGIEPMFCKVAEARNTSTQVKDKSIAELEDQFAIIKNAISLTPYKDNVSYKENSSGKIDITFLIQLLYLFNLKDAISASQATMAYNSKSKCLNNYIQHYLNDECTSDNPYYQMSPIISSIFSLYDFVEENISKYYTSNTKRKYGSLDCIKTSNASNKYTTTFYDKKLIYCTPMAFIIPIMYSLSALLIVKNNQYQWKLDPFKALDNIGYDIVDIIITAYKKGNSLNAIGKNNQLYELCYSKVRNYAFEQMIQYDNF